MRPASAPNTAMNDRIVAGLLSVSTKVPTKQRSRSLPPPAWAARSATGARQIDHAIHSRNAAPPSASGSRAAVSAWISTVTPNAPTAP